MSAGSLSRLTRSASKRSVSQAIDSEPLPATPVKSPKKSRSATPGGKSTPAKSPASPAGNFTVPNLTGPVLENPVLEVPSRLNFDLDAAKQHLIRVDPRFKTLMENVPCKPYEEAADEHTMLNPFKALSTSILGQQVSWLAAKAITYKFIRLFFPDLPEKQEPGAPSPPFPTPAQVIACPYATLRTAGLSGRKAEYVLDISARFADGRLSAEKLLDMSDQEVYDALIQVRGIGPWSVEMFSMFVLRRSNVLSPGDLGLQKGLLTWFGQDSPQILPAKMVKPQPEREATPPPSEDGAKPPTEYLTTPKAGTESDGSDTQKPRVVPEPAPPFPESKTLTREKLRGRANKKIKGNLYLTAEEMEELTAAWVPYRSVGLYYLWSLKDGPDSSI